MQPPASISYPVPFFPDYVINFPYYYSGGNNLTGITIYTVKGRYVKPKDKTWILRNPDSFTKQRQEFYGKNSVGLLSQTLYESDIRHLYRTMPKEKTMPKQSCCRCGRKNEEDSWGCSRYPSCIDNSGDDGFY
jgi:hypothetical protein